MHLCITTNWEHRDSSHDDFDRHRPRQVTFRKDVLQHLGIRPGERIELDKLPGGRVSLKAMRPAGKIDSFVGLLKDKSKKIATLDESHEAAASGWAGRK